MWSTDQSVSAPSSSAMSQARAMASRELPGPTWGAKKPILMAGSLAGPVSRLQLRGCGRRPRPDRSPPALGPHDSAGQRPEAVDDVALDVVADVEDAGAE